MKAPAASFAPDQIVVAITSFAGWPHFLITAGQRVRASSPVVQQHPYYFLPDGATDEECRRAIAAVTPERPITQHVPIASAPEPLADEDAMLAIRNVAGGAVDGDVHLHPAISLSARMKVHNTHPLVRSYPEAFVPVVPKGRNRGNSVRALRDNFEMRKGPDGEYIRETDQTLVARFGEYRRFPVHFAGQWIPRPAVYRPDEFEEL
jgi:hypothetical protein